jgi:hypothetical protein
LDELIRFHAPPPIEPSTAIPLNPYPTETQFVAEDVATINPSALMGDEKVKVMENPYTVENPFDVIVGG